MMIKVVQAHFQSGRVAQERGLSYLPECYVIPTSHRPSLTPDVANVPTIDFGKLKQGSQERAIVIQEIRIACRQLGFFQVSLISIIFFWLDDLHVPFIT